MASERYYIRRHRCTKVTHASAVIQLQNTSDLAPGQLHFMATTLTSDASVLSNAAAEVPSMLTPTGLHEPRVMPSLKIGKESDNAALLQVNVNIVQPIHEAIQTSPTLQPASSVLSFLQESSDIVYDEQSETLAGTYKLRDTIGHGTYGTVRLATHIPSGIQYAIKVLHKSQMTDNKHILRVQREIRFLRLLHHPHIIKVKDFFESQLDIFIVMEHIAGGELFDYIVSHGRVKEAESRRFFRQIISAVAYCHENSVIHRDLKPENLLLDERKNIKLIDLGFANNYKQSQLLDTYCGSPNYAAPEMISGKRYNGPEVDVWSLGIILYALVCGCLPFEDKNLRRLCKKIVAGEYTDPVDIVGADCRHLISRLLDVNPMKRAKLKEIFSHPWVNDGFDEQPISYVPIRRLIDNKSLNQDAISQLRNFGFKEDDISSSLKESGFNPITSTYHLILELTQRKTDQLTLRASSIDKSMEQLSLNRAAVSMSMPGNLNADSRIDPHRATGRVAGSRSPYTPEAPDIYNPRKLSVAITRPAAASVNPRRGSAVPDAPMISSSPRADIDTMTVPSPRVVSGWFVTYSTTSSKPSQQVLDEVHLTLRTLCIPFIQEGWVSECTANEVRFSIEVVQVSRLGICGVIYKRHRGAVGDYRDICAQIQDTLPH